VIAEDLPSLGDSLGTAWPVPRNVDEIVGVLLFISIPKRDSLENDKCGGAADSDRASGCILL
jgi:hypothetical protein